jgi:hypothetical protein
MPISTKRALDCAERRARVQPCHMSLGLMRALAPEVRLSNHLRRTQPRTEMTLSRMRRKAYLSGFYETAVEFKGILTFLYS